MIVCLAGRSVNIHLNKIWRDTRFSAGCLPRSGGNGALSLQESPLEKTVELKDYK